MSVTAIRQRITIGAVLAMLAAALVVAGQQPVEASTVAQGPAAVFARAAQVSAPDISAGWFAKYDGIDGESQAASHEEWIRIETVKWGAKQPGTITGSRTRAEAKPNKFVISFPYEKASPKLLDSIARGKVIPKLEVELTLMIDGARKTYLKYELTNVWVKSYSVSGSADAGPPTVVVGNNFEEVKVTYTEFNDDGSKAGNVETVWKIGQ